MSSTPRHSALVTPAWLHARLPETTVLDATWYMPSAGRSAATEHAAARIPGARRFDIDGPGLHDAESDLPHMLPAPAAFAEAADRLTLRHDRPAVVYAQTGFVGAARAWWMLRYFGLRDVYVLDGGLRAWRAAGYDVVSGTIEEVGGSGNGGGSGGGKGGFEVRVKVELLANMADMVKAAQGGEGVILDARSQGRFHGTSPEPRPGLMSGRMPGAFCLPSGKVVTEDGTLKGEDDVWRALEECGADVERVKKGPVLLTCGSGVTAAIDALALYEVGIEAAVYDGSWSEYGSHHDNPLEKS